MAEDNVLAVSVAMTTMTIARADAALATSEAVSRATAKVVTLEESVTASVSKRVTSAVASRATAKVVTLEENVAENAISGQTSMTKIKKHMDSNALNRVHC